MGAFSGADFFQGQLTEAEYARLPERLRKYILVEGQFLTAPSEAPRQWDSFLTRLSDEGWRVFVRDVEVPTDTSVFDYFSSGEYMPFQLLVYKEGASKEDAVLAVDAAAKFVGLTSSQAAQAYKNTFTEQVIQPTIRDTKKAGAETGKFLEKVLPWVAITAGAVAVIYVTGALKPLIKDD